MAQVQQRSGRWEAASRSVCPRPPGKTTLVKALTGDAAVQPRDQLFATLDVTAHAGSLPSRMTVIYLDTIGFLSQLPHGLVESFSATLEDVAHSVSVLCWGQDPSRMTRQAPGGSCSSKGHEGKTGGL